MLDHGTDLEPFPARQLFRPTSRHRALTPLLRTTGAALQPFDAKGFAMRAASLRPRCWKLALLLSLSLLSTLALAVEPPFEGVISKDEAFVRSGPSEDDYYPTTKLSRGAPVKVVREDFGWYLIEPPAGSHSWVNAEHIERRSGQRGIVITDTFDRIGTDLELPQQAEEVRHRLAKRETVEILGEAELETARGKVRMLKIKPPRGEYRYIHKNDVTPQSGETKPSDLPLADRRPSSKSKADDQSIDLRPGDSQPIESLLPTNETEGVKTPEVTEQTLPAVAAAKAPTPEAAPDKNFEIPPGHIDANVRLKQIDDEFKLMAEKPAAQWNLAAIRDQYLALRDSLQNAGTAADAEAFRKDIDKRLAAVGRYQTRYNDFLAVQQIMRETESRDEQIRQQYLSGRQTVATQMPVTTHISRSTPHSAAPPSDPFAASNTSNQTTPGASAQQPPQWPHRPTPNSASSNWGATPGQRPRSNQSLSAPQFGQPSPSGHALGMPSPFLPRKFDGAGIVQRAAASQSGAPQYVLLAPDGRVLTYLQPGPGVNLEAYVGKSMGLLGQRAFRQDLNADLLVVRQATPVRLKTTP